MLPVQSTMAAEAAAAGPQRIQGPSGARFRGPLAHDDGLLRVQIYTASDVAGGRPTLVRGTTASLDGEIVAFLPEGGGPELQVPRAEVSRLAKQENSHSFCGQRRAATAFRCPFGLFYALSTSSPALKSMVFHSSLRNLARPEQARGLLWAR